MALSIGSLARNRPQQRISAPQPRVPRRDPRRFGRRGVATLEESQPAKRSRSEEIRLFAMTFAAGFIFMSVFIA